MNLYEQKKKFLLAVCCELRTNLKNHYLIKDSLKIGDFLSNTEYFLVNSSDINNSVELTNGTNSVFFEVYEVSFLTLQKINKLKNFYFVESNENSNVKKIINTPYGKAIIYLSNNKITDQNKIIKDYDYYDYHNYKNK